MEALLGLIVLFGVIGAAWRRWGDYPEEAARFWKWLTRPRRTLIKQDMRNEVAELWEAVGGCLLIVLALGGILLSIYGLVAFVKWSWLHS